MRQSRFPVLVTILVLAFFYLPIIVLVANSFNDSAFGGRWGGFSLRWYRMLLGQKEIWRAFWNTLLIAVSATALSTVIGTTAALALHRYKTRLQRVHYLLIYTPLVIPEILTGMSLLMLFVAIGLQTGLFTIFLAHVTFCISYTALVVLARLQDFDWTVVEAARDLGASMWQTTLRVLIPMLLPGLMAAALLAFTLSIDDFVISFFVAGPGSTTLPIRIYSMIKFGYPPLVNVLSTLLLVLTFLTVGLSQKLVSKGKSK